MPEESKNEKRRLRETGTDDPQSRYDSHVKKGRDNGTDETFITEWEQ